jgi:hypothetical protein
MPSRYRRWHRPNSAHSHHLSAVVDNLCRYRQQREKNGNNDDEGDPAMILQECVYIGPSDADEYEAQKNVRWHPGPASVPAFEQRQDDADPNPVKRDSPALCIHRGRLMSYGIDVVDQYRQAAGYVDRILRGGTKPAELPVQLPTKFVMSINLKTAKELGLDVPLLLQQRADELVE